MASVVEELAVPVPVRGGQERAGAEARMSRGWVR